MLLRHTFLFEIRAGEFPADISIISFSHQTTIDTGRTYDDRMEELCSDIDLQDFCPVRSNGVLASSAIGGD